MSTPIPKPQPAQSIAGSAASGRLGSPLVRRLVAILAVGLGAGFLAAGAALWLGMRSVAAEVGDPYDRTPPPSRLYSAPLELQQKLAIDETGLGEYLIALGYRRADEAAASSELPRGVFGTTEGAVRLTTRSPIHPAGPPAGAAVVVEIEDGHIASLTFDGQPLERLALEPVELHAYHDDRLIERRSSACEAGGLPEAISLAIRAAEDDSFFDHHGVSVSGIARAAAANLRAGTIRQGGSTITQQLARNRFLTHERSWRRKAREALMALVLETRHDKDELLCAYADLVYLGVRDGVSIVGVGAAAATYFGKTVSDLTHAEAAAIAGMIAAPSRYAPTGDLERARARRNWVLDRMNELGWLSEKDYLQARSEKLRVRAAVGERALDARHYADAVRHELQDRLGVETIEQAGLRIDGTLGWLDQTQAQQALVAGTAELEERQADRLGGDFEGALVSIEPQSGAVLAYVGGRSYDTSQFDRVRQARRQIGSLFKPIVFATAFAQRVAHPETPLADRPIAIHYRDELWTPKNSAERYRGTVTARQALELSVNSATLRLAASTGLGQIRRQATAFGLDVSAAPAAVLGAVEASPWEMAEVYAAFARDGVLQRHTTIASVYGADGRLVDLPARPARKVLDVETVHLVNTTLQGVLRRGTAARAWRAGLRDPLAGKTGTSNDKRDSWFVGYSPDRLTVVWTGRDGFGETPFSGTTGALPIWTRYTLAMRPADGYREFDESGLNDAFLDFDNAELWPGCPDEILHPDYRCESEEPAEAEESYILVSKLPTPVADAAALTKTFYASRSAARPMQARGLDIRLAGTRADLGTSGSVAANAEPASAGDDEYQLRDFFKINPRGSIVERAVERVPLDGESLRGVGR